MDFLKCFLCSLTKRSLQVVKRILQPVRNLYIKSMNQITEKASTLSPYRCTEAKSGLPKSGLKNSRLMTESKVLHFTNVLTLKQKVKKFPGEEFQIRIYSLSLYLHRQVLYGQLLLNSPRTGRQQGQAVVAVRCKQPAFFLFPAERDFFMPAPSSILLYLPHNQKK